MLRTLIAIFMVVALGGCTDQTTASPKTSDAGADMSGSNGPPAGTNPTPLGNDEFEVVGSVAFIDLEGGFYAIHSDDGKKFDPINLPEAFRKDGLKVKLRARPQRDLASIRMYGEIIEVINIEAM